MIFLKVLFVDLCVKLKVGMRGYTLHKDNIKNNIFWENTTLGPQKVLLLYLCCIIFNIL